MFREKNNKLGAAYIQILFAKESSRMHSKLLFYLILHWKSVLHYSSRTSILHDCIQYMSKHAVHVFLSSLFCTV